MIDHTEAAAARAFEQSALVRTMEHGGRALTTAVSESRLIAAGRKWSAAAAVRLGQVLLVAAITHVALMLAIAKPVSWLWLILPSLVAAIGVVLMVLSRPARMEP
jgi:hypothetical protein